MPSEKCSIDIDSVSLRFRIYGAEQQAQKLSFLSRVLRRHHSKPKEFWLFKDLSIHFGEGERVGVVGRNGAGKSTLLHLIGGIYMPTKGSIRVSGRTSHMFGFGIGMDLQLSGSENVILMGTMMGIPAKEMIARMQSILEFADLKGFASTPVKYYSNGMRQRLAFSTATEIAPDILLSDEVFAGGDAEFINKAKKRIATLIDKSNIFLFVSHNLNLLESVTQRTIWIDNGIIKADGPTDAVCKEYRAFINTRK